MKRLDHYWYRPHPIAWALAPLSWIYCSLMSLRRAGYRLGLLRSHAIPLPVVIVGNITVGGVGKTPLVIWLVEQLRAAGLRPGVVSRGYRGEAESWPQRVYAGSDPALVGDEPVLIALRTGVPIAVGPDRVAAARLLLEEGEVDLIVADDGLQHYRLKRDLEIAVIDGKRGFGNGLCLPAGPLREPRGRLRSVDFVVTNGGAGGSAVQMALEPREVVNLRDPEQRLPLDAFAGQRVHGVAGIGDPSRFFATLRSLGMDPVEHPFPDHHRFQPSDLQFAESLPVLMTEKDAVKCRPFAAAHHWYLPVSAQLPSSFAARLLERLKR